MKYFIGFLILCITLGLAHGVAHSLVVFFELNFPASVLGMLLLVAGLKLKIISLKHCEPLANKLLIYFPLFFIPAGVGIVQYTDLIRQDWHIITLAVCSATVLTLLLVGKLATALFRDKQ
jgi:holin-like protein